MNGSRFGYLGALSGFLAVAFGAFGAHGLREKLSPALLDILETGARYQLIHAAVLVLIAIALHQRPRYALTVAGWLFLAGQVLFPGSLYTLALTGLPAWGAVTPIGGLCYLAGWIALAAAFARSG
jgi:uncharacterized membrane protein YgdD (TMEM256/DUF423 family)